MLEFYIDEDSMHDIEIMQRLQQDDEEAFRLLWNRYHARLRRFFYHLTWDQSRAEDFVQETFLRLWLARKRWEPTGKFTTYLFQIAKNYWLNQKKKDIRNPPPQSLNDLDEDVNLDLAFVCSATQPELVLWENYRRWRIGQAVAQLPEMYRLVFVLCHYEEMSYQEIADVLAIPIGTVKSRMNAAMKILRRQLKDIE